MAIQTMPVDAGSETRPGPPRVGILLTPVAGWATYRENLERVARTVPDLDAQFHDVNYYKSGGAIETLRERWLRSVPSHYTGLSRATFEFYKGQRAGPYDAVLTNASVSVLFSGRVRKTPTIMVIDSTRGQLDEMGGYGGYIRPPLVEKYKRRLGNQFFDATTMVVVTSRWAKAGVVADYGVPEDKVKVIPFGADVTFWRPGLDRAAWIAGSTGALRRWRLPTKGRRAVARLVQATTLAGRGTPHRDPRTCRAHAGRDRP